MALLTCRDCGHQVSRTATSCPNCGRKFNRTSPVTWGCAGLFALALIGICTSVTNRSTPAPKSTIQPSPPPQDETREVDALVTQLLSREAIRSVDAEEEEALVNPAFWNYATLDGKRALVKTLAMYCKAHAKYGGAVVLKDARSGRKLAEYSILGGVKIAGEE